MSLAGQRPEISGSPHGVRGTVQVLAALPGFAAGTAGVCAAMAIGRASALTRRTTSTFTMVFIVPSQAEDAAARRRAQSWASPTLSASPASGHAAEAPVGPPEGGHYVHFRS